LAWAAFAEALPKLEILCKFKPILCHFSMQLVKHKLQEIQNIILFLLYIGELCDLLLSLDRRKLLTVQFKLIEIDDYVGGDGHLLTDKLTDLFVVVL